MKAIAVAAVVALSVSIVSPAFVQEGDDEPLTPAGTIHLLWEARVLMAQAEEQLLRGVVERSAQSVESAERREKDVVDRLGEILKKASVARNPKLKPQKDPWRSDPRRPWDTAREPYPQGRYEEPSIFKSEDTRPGSWGQLPAAVRQAILDASREDVPPEFRELWKKYFESLQKTDAH